MSLSKGRSTPPALALLNSKTDANSTGLKKYLLSIGKVPHAAKRRSLLSETGQEGVSGLLLFFNTP